MADHSFYGLEAFVGGKSLFGKKILIIGGSKVVKLFLDDLTMMRMIRRLVNGFLIKKETSESFALFGCLLDA